MRLKVFIGIIGAVALSSCASRSVEEAAVFHDDFSSKLGNYEDYPFVPPGGKAPAIVSGAAPQSGSIDDLLWGKYYQPSYQHTRSVSYVQTLAPERKAEVLSKRPEGMPAPTEVPVPEKKMKRKNWRR